MAGKAEKDRGMGKQGTKRRRKEGKREGQRVEARQVHVEREGEGNGERRDRMGKRVREEESKRVRREQAAPF